VHDSGRAANKLTRGAGSNQPVAIAHASLLFDVSRGGRLQGIPTTLIVTSFVDRIFLCVTQINKIGSITLATTHQVTTHTEWRRHVVRASSGCTQTESFIIHSHSLHRFFCALVVVQAPSASASDAPSFSLSTLLGVRHAPLPQLLARRLIEGLSSSAQEHMAAKSLLLSIGLKKTKSSTPAPQGDSSMMALTDEELQTVREIVNEVDKIKQW
jgi:hypothetical protein